MIYLTNISIIRLRKFIPDHSSSGIFFVPVFSRPSRSAFAQLDFSCARLVAETLPQHLALMLPVLMKTCLGWERCLGVPLLGCYFCCTNQFIVQRVLDVRNVLGVRRGTLFAGLLKLPVLFLRMLSGVIASIFMAGQPQCDAVFPALAMIIGDMPFLQPVLSQHSRACWNCTSS